ncbi:hypothetical protein SAMN02799632_03277 [Acinetobacter pittii]|uniref:hypothetical protein n=2 Tax=Acinetobacter TaxID=469 RepID=UPI0007084644|nr:hypothetical protein [Acinetobacter pittii]KQE43904.1 hypothetical protein APD46_06705 [Acinetobacter pittii]KRJ48308.1 hypothetical protein APC88_04385 [Acinetobacter pittii]MCU4428776.1 hypothetical protein [Acinetobacter pittii]OTN35901.1 hypothetical protein B9Y11_17965 [Acinetobacter pittii]WPP92882.1 hypothetical protein SOI80_04455 [Acinetobacter pittii]
MKPEQFIREFGVEKARDVVEGSPDGHKGYNDVINQYTRGVWFSRDVMLSDLKRLVESLDLVEKLGGYGKCKFYMTGMKLNKCDSVKCPKTGLIVSRAALEIAINDYRESIYGGGDES